MSLAALKAFQDVLSTSTKHSTNDGNEHNMDDFVCNVAWKTWLSIGTQSSNSQKGQPYIPSQPFLTALALIFPGLFHCIKSR